MYIILGDISAILLHTKTIVTIHRVGSGHEECGETSDALSKILWPGASIANGSYLDFLRTKSSHLGPKWDLHSCLVV